MTMLALRSPTSLPDSQPSAGAIEVHRVPQITIHSFCDTPETLRALEVAVADRRMSRTHAQVHEGGISAAIDLYRNAATPDVLVIESPEEIGQFHLQLDRLSQVCDSGTKLIVIGRVNDIAFYRDLLARGVTEYVVAPVDPVSIIALVARLYRKSDASKLGRSLAFIGAKGGVGSSTIAHNVAATMARVYGSDVILADMDLPFGSADLDFGVNQAQGIADALNDANRLDDALLERLLTKCGEHLSVLTAPASLLRSHELDESVFEPLLDIALATVPFVVLDIPHVWTSWAEKTLIAADEVVITAEPDLTNLRNAKNLIDFLRQARPNDGPPRLVINQIGVPKRSEITADKFGAALQIEPIACIPFAPLMFSTAANNGRAIVDGEKSPIGKALAAIAQGVSGRAAAKTKRGRFDFGRLWGS
jgi:pilus assembly protein CpaE